MAEFTAKPSLWRIFLLIMISTAFVTIGLWMIGAFGLQSESRRYGSLYTSVLGWTSIIFFGLCGLASIQMLFDTEVQVRINASGIYWKRYSDYTILWSDITNVSVWEFQRQKSIILTLRDPARYLSVESMGKLARANRALTGGDVAITLSGTDGRFDDAMAAIGHYWRR
jgi:hypothetical protein